MLHPVLAFLATGLAAGSSSAQPVATPPAQASVLVAERLNCTFYRGQAANYQTRTANLQEVLWEGDFILDNINKYTGRARFSSKGKGGDVALHPFADGMNFVEKTSAGTVNLTTVYTFKNEAGKFVAVTSRHDIGTEPMPSQYHGECEVTR